MSPYFLFSLPFQATLLHNTKWWTYNLRNNIGGLFIAIFRVSTFQKRMGHVKNVAFILALFSL